jgi:two-component system, response regulator FlrC
LSMNPSEQLDTLRGDAPRPKSIHDMVEKVIERDPSTIAGSGLMIRSGTTVQEMEKALILETLRSTNNNRTEAAKLLGISIRTLRNKLHEYRGAGIPVEE